MHVFLTGNIQVGKTTLIRKFLERSGLSADGFLTYWESSGYGVRKLYLAPYAPEPQDIRHCIARVFNEDRLLKAKYIEDIFDIHGTRILAESGKRDIIIMDELGVLETDSPVFRAAVFEYILGNVPILGVIKQKNTDFLDTIRFHPSVRIYEVTQENGEKILSQLRRQFLASFRKSERTRSNQLMRR